MKSSKPDFIPDNRLYPIWSEAESQNFLPIKPWSVCLSDTHPRGEFESSILRVGRRIHISGLLPYSLVKKTTAANEEPQMHDLYVYGLVFRVPSGQYVYCPLVYQEPQERFRFVQHPESEFVKDLFHEDAQVHLPLSRFTRDLEGKPLVFDFQGEEDLVFTLACPITGTDLAGEMIMDTNNTTVIAAHRNKTQELVGHGPWYRSFELAGAVYGVEGGAPRLDDEGPDYQPPVDQIDD